MKTKCSRIYLLSFSDIQVKGWKTVRKSCSGQSNNILTKLNNYIAEYILDSIILQVK